MKLVFPPKEQKTQIMLRVPAQMKKELQAKAKQYGVTLTRLILQILESAKPRL